MATIREYFEKDFSNCLSIRNEWSTHPSFGEIKIVPRVHQDLDANAKYVSFYIPECDQIKKVCDVLLAKTEEVLKMNDGVHVLSGTKSTTDGDSRNLVFTNRVFIYSETNLTADELQSLREFSGAKGLFFSFRGPDYMNDRNLFEKPLAFICHDSNDKDAIARDLAIRLTKMMCPVWYDEFSLNVGDSLRQKIEDGIKNCKKCVLILSPSFLRNGGWTKKEFDSVFTRELIEEKKLILPVWHEVTKKDVYQYSPSLADVVAVDSKLGLEEVSRKLFRSISMP